MTAEKIIEAAVNDMVSGREKPFCNETPGNSDELEYYTEYAEPGYDNPKKGIITGNWNNFPKRLCKILEKAGYSCEFYDEWSTCQGCYKLVRTSPDSYGWKQSYVIYNDCELICHNCVKEDLDEYENYLLNSVKRADTLDIDWESRGFTRFNEDRFESGFHSFQTDNPQDVKKLLPKDHDFLFVISDKSQFSTGFDVWIRKKEED